MTKCDDDGNSQSVCLTVNPPDLNVRVDSSGSKKFNHIRLLETLVGVISGAAIALFSSYILHNAKTERENQIWYEDRFIFQGVVKIQSYSAILSLAIENYRDNSDLIDVSRDFPRAALAELVILLDDQSHATALAYVRSRVKKNPDERKVTDNELAALATTVAESAKRLKTFLLKQKISSKTDAFQLRDSKEVEGEISLVRSELKKLTKKEAK